MIQIFNNLPQFLHASRISSLDLSITENFLDPHLSHTGQEREEEELKYI